MNRNTFRILLIVLTFLGVIIGTCTTEAHASTAKNGGDFVVQINAGPKTWMIKKQARKVDAVVDGLTVRTSGDCTTADLCVDVNVDHYDHAEALDLSWGQLNNWGGLCTFPQPDHYVIYLNTLTTAGKLFRQQVALHEFGHALGLPHMEGTGMMNPDGGRPDFFNDIELATLWAKYAPYTTSG